MRLLRCSDTGDFGLPEVFADDEMIPPYATLSHMWEADQEVTFKDLVDGTGKGKTGYKKIWFCAQQAKRDGLQYFWVDTCCIDKSDHVELQTAINSMFYWYQNAARCYVFLSDVSTMKQKTSDGDLEYAWELAFRRSRWFRRGWTLQELLAPLSVEFFSQEWKKLGDKQSLRQRIHKATGVPCAALEGAPLSQFSDKQRFSWIQSRETTVDEDKAYSLLGIFGVEMPLRYGEGSPSAFKRLEEEFAKLNICIQDLRLTDPRDDKKRIEDTKGGLLKKSYHWILENPDFQRWRNNSQARLLWIKGDPGKGKTMLLCGIIDELSKCTDKTTILSYFFFQATDSRINSATAVLRGLLFMLVSQQPSLVSHLRKKHDQTGKALFEDANAWVVLCEIFTNILHDPSSCNMYFFVDALDECVQDLDKLLAFLVQMSALSPRVKWVLTSRNYTNIEQRLQLNDSGTRLSLELKENAVQVSYAVDAYIDHRLIELEQIQYDQLLQSSIREKMQQKANGTFLWVSLVMKELKNALSWEILQVLEEVPTELKGVYWRMMDHIKQLKRRNPDLCRQVLSTVVTTYRPLHLQELCVLADLPDQGPNAQELTTIIVKMCGSFLTLREDNVYIIHQSARDFLLDEAAQSVFPSGTGEVHQDIFYRSIQVMSRSLQRDIYQLDALGYPVEQVQQLEPDPLAALRYSCIYWIDHLCDWSPNSSIYDAGVLKNGGMVDSFMRKKYIYWLEALSLCTSIPKAIVAMSRLEALTEVIPYQLIPYEIVITN
ncbi:hypothetical protein EJ04DRAFT_157950 [Polyplosphaeria fusca]|uniref:NACHT domain-containing protein n=1 Tax=Polyplosphaeria fusca TaxID=682080 RepID=A0A9P4R1T6_9PLEO|nr:hypothetical protein EJ04DRAFT_157950 [Polyplosphaeria fusca]